MMMVDGVIVMGSLLVFGDWRIPLFSFITIFFIGRVIDYTLHGFTYDKTLFIISDKHEEIRNSIIHDLKRGGTFLQGKGMYNQAEKQIIFTVLSPREMYLLEEYVNRIDPQAMEVKVTGFQWGWRFEYPQSGITSTTLNLPVNRQVLLKLTSTDVIHSFWVPEFRVKQDALPGDTMVKELRITPSQLGEFTLRCAELCGAAHAYMESKVVVMEQAGFDAWVADQSKLSNDPVERGIKWAKQFGCIGCHTTDGTSPVGPSWKGLAGKQETLSDGGSVTVDDAYLHESIVSPNAKIAKGFNANIMPPNFGQTMTDAQIADVIAYIKTLK